MFRKFVGIFLIFSVAQSVFAAEYIVKYKSGKVAVLGSFQAMNLNILDRDSAGQLVKINIPDKQEAATLVRLNQLPQIEYVVKNFELHSFFAPPTIQALREQWALQKINAIDAWKLAGNKGSRNITVAVIDTGVDYNHESLKDNMVKGFDFINNNDNPMDVTGKNPGHGTHCSGIIGASGTVENGTSGISPVVSIMPLRFLDENGSGDLMAGIKAIDYAIQHKVRVISASWGASVSASQAQPLIEAVKRASDAGVIFVMAAANDGKSNDTSSVYPANAKFANTITVAASGDKDEKPEWSNYGTAMVDLASPGLTIMSTIPNNQYKNLSGTSMATPLVAGTVALLLAQDPTLTGEQVRSLLQATAAKVQIETACNCRIDAGAAMKALLTKKMFVAPAAMTMNLGDTHKLTAFNFSGALKFQSSNPAIIDVGSDGTMTAKSVGAANITVTDGAGLQASTLDFHVADGKQPPAPSTCPYDPQTCQMMCGIQPDLPYCKK